MILFLIPLFIMAQDLCLMPQKDSELLKRLNFNASVESLAKDAISDNILIKLKDKSNILYKDLTSESDFREYILNNSDISDFLDLNDFLLVRDTKLELLGDAFQKENDLMDIAKGPWSVVDEGKGKIYDLQSHFIKITSKKDPNKSVIISLKKALVFKLINLDEALKSIEEDLKKEIESKHTFNKNKLRELTNSKQLSKIEKVLGYRVRTDVLPLKFTLNAYGNEIVGDIDNIDNTSLARPGEGAIEFNFNSDDFYDDQTLSPDDTTVEDGRLFLRGKYIGLTATFDMANGAIFPWVGYRKGKLKMAFFGQPDLWPYISTLRTGGMLRIGRGEIAIGMGAYVVPFVASPGFLLGATTMRKRRRNIDLMREDGLNPYSEKYFLKLKDTYGRFNRWTIGIGDPYFGIGLRRRFTIERQKDVTSYQLVDKDTAYKYREDSKRWDIGRLFKKSLKDGLINLEDPISWEIGNKVKIENIKDKLRLKAFGTMLIPIGFSLGRKFDRLRSFEIHANKTDDKTLNISLIPQYTVERGKYKSLVEILGNQKNKGIINSFVDSFDLDISTEEGKKFWNEVVLAKKLNPEVLEKLQPILKKKRKEDTSSVDYQMVKNDVDEFYSKYSLTPNYSEGNRMRYKRRKKIFGLQLLGVPGFASEINKSEGKSVTNISLGTMDRDLISYQSLQERPLSRFRSKSQLASFNTLKIEEREEFDGLSAEMSFIFTKVRRSGDKNNFNKRLKEINDNFPFSFSQLQERGDKDERELYLSISFTKEDIESLPKSQIHEKLVQKGKWPREKVLKFLKDLREEYDVDKIKYFIKKNPILSIGAISLILNKKADDFKVSTSSSLYDAPFQMVDDFYLKFSVSEDTKKMISRKDDIFKSIDKALHLLQRDPILKLSHAKVSTKKGNISKLELESKLIALKKELREYSEEKNIGVNTEIKSLKPSDLNRVKEKYLKRREVLSDLGYGREDYEEEIHLLNKEIEEVSRALNSSK